MHTVIRDCSLYWDLSDILSLLHFPVFFSSVRRCVGEVMLNILRQHTEVVKIVGYMLHVTCPFFIKLALMVHLGIFMDLADFNAESEP